MVLKVNVYGVVGACIWFAGLKDMGLGELLWFSRLSLAPYRRSKALPVWYTPISSGLTRFVFAANAPFVTQ